MAKTAFHDLQQALHNFRQTQMKIRRWRLIGLGVISMLAWFIGLSWVEQSHRFGETGRVVLFVSFLVGLLFLAVWTSINLARIRQDEQQLANYLEAEVPDLEQRLLTSVELGEKAKLGISSQLLGQLWEETRKTIEAPQIKNLLKPESARLPWVGSLLVCAAFLLMVGSVPDYLRSSMTLLWPWSTPVPQPVLSITPGDLQLQQGAPLSIVVAAEKGEPDQVTLFMQKDGLNWEAVPMIREGSQATYVHHLEAVAEAFTYYIDADEFRSRQYKISVVEFPRLESVSVAYQFPAYTGLEPKTTSGVGNIVAPQGTQITLTATFNKAIASATLQYDDNENLVMTVDNAVSGPARRASGSFTVERDRSFTLLAVDQEELEIENPPRYVVQAIIDAPPEVSVLRPGRDLRVMPLEEVSLLATATDDYGLTQFSLHYQVAGQSKQEVVFLKNSQQTPYLQSSELPEMDEGQNPEEEPNSNLLQTNVEGSTMIYMEDLQVSPGDFVSYYLTAADNREPEISKVVSDIYFLEIVPTNEEFRKAAQMAGGGGMRGGGQRQSSSALAQNQKKVIAATWKLISRQLKEGAESVEDDVQTVAESQYEILQRAQMSLRRLAERLTFSDETYDQAVQHMEQAVQHMETAVEKLTERQLEEALAAEQNALKHVLKAESEGRQTQVQMARGQAGGGGSASRERSDLSKLFEMEMGRLENRYELPQRGNRSLPQGAQQEDALRKLQELARRQEQLNRRQSNFNRRQDQLSEEQRRRRLEALRREQEQLRQQTEALSRQLSQLSQRGSGSGQNSNRQSGRTSNPRNDRERQQQLNRIARQMREAEQSLGQQQSQQAEEQSRQALQALREQEQALRNQQNGPGGDRNGPNGPTRRPKRNRSESELQRLAENVKNLRQEMEAMKRQIEDLTGLPLGQGNNRNEPNARGRGGDLARPNSEEGGSTLGNRSVSESDLEAMQETLRRARQLARGLSQRGTRGAGWSYDARSIQRQLTQKEIEDFLAQPDLWQQLLSVVQEMESTVTSQAEIGELQKKLFTLREQGAPDHYKQMVEEYYRNLSEEAVQ